MSLGEAFIEVRADLRPFARDLRTSVKPIVEAFERETKEAVTRTLAADAESNGKQIGEKVARGMRNTFAKKFKETNFFVGVAAALGSALDDGISALPTEVKAALVAGAILAAPIVGAFLTGAIVASIGAGIAGVGIALASQFEDVQLAAASVGNTLRETFVNSASSFGRATLNALALIDQRVRALSPQLKEIFDVSSGFVNPLTRGLIGGFEELIDSIRKSIKGIEPFVDELGASIVVVFDAIGQSIEILTETGEDGRTALRDLVSILATLIVSASVALKVFTNLYAAVRDVVLFLDRYLGIFSVSLDALASFFQATDNRSNRIHRDIKDNKDFSESFSGLLKATDKQRKAVEDYSKALDDMSDSVKNQLKLNIDWEESLDRVAESLKENGKNLDIGTDKGRDNAREFLSAIEIAEARTIEMLQRGALSNQQAIGFFNQQIEALRALARQAGISDAKFNELFGQIVATSNLRLSSETMGVNNLNAGLAEAAARANTLRSRLLAALRAAFSALSFLPGISPILIPQYADGDIVNRPTLGVFGEDGPEVIIPLTKPARAAQLMRESGLDRMVSGGNTQVLVYVGNEQLDARTVRIVQRNNSFQAMALAHGGRSF